MRFTTAQQQWDYFYHVLYPRFIKARNKLKIDGRYLDVISLERRWGKVYNSWVNSSHQKFGD